MRYKIHKKYALRKKILFFSIGIFGVSCQLFGTNSTENCTCSLSGDVVGTQNATVVNQVGGVSAWNIASGANAANTATSSNIPNALVSRDALGNFEANIVTATLNGNAASATSAATSAGFFGFLSGDVRGSQSTTVVNVVGGVGAANIASGANAANAATSQNIPNALVSRDTLGNFSAGTITATLNGNAETATTAWSVADFTGNLSGDVVGSQNATVVNQVGGVSAWNIANGTNAANTATSQNIPNALVSRDILGNFSAGTITATLNGNAETATTAGSVANFTGYLSGDVVGSQNATVVNQVGGVSAWNIANGANTANTATSQNIPNALVSRDSLGNFEANIVTATLNGNAATATTAGSVANFTGYLSGDVFGTQSTTVVNQVGGVSAWNIAQGANAANMATSQNIPNALVSRDALGNFSAGTITATLNGNAASATSATTSAGFSGALSGDVGGIQSATVINQVGGVSAANIASGANAANAATSADGANAIVMRDASCNFASNSITLNELDLLSTNTLLINGNLSLAPGTTLFVDNIYGESGSFVENMSVTNLTVHSLSNPSDRRIKTDITRLDDDLCLAIVNQLVPYEYNYVPAVRKAMSDNGSRHVGFIAQELAKIDPRFMSIATGEQELGDLTIEDLAHIRQELFIPIIIGALKAGDKKVLSMAEAAEVRELQNRVRTLEALLEALMASKK